MSVGCFHVIYQIHCIYEIIITLLRNHVSKELQRFHSNFVIKSTIWVFEFTQLFIQPLISLNSFLQIESKWMKDLYRAFFNPCQSVNQQDQSELKIKLKLKNLNLFQCVSSIRMHLERLLNPHASETKFNSNQSEPTFQSGRPIRITPRSPSGQTF